MGSVGASILGMGGGESTLTIKVKTISTITTTNTTTTGRFEKKSVTQPQDQFFTLKLSSFSLIFTINFLLQQKQYRKRRNDGHASVGLRLYVFSFLV